MDEVHSCILDCGEEEPFDDEVGLRWDCAMEADSLVQEKWVGSCVAVCMAQHAGRDVGHRLVRGALAAPESNKSFRDGEKKDVVKSWAKLRCFPSWREGSTGT